MSVGLDTQLMRGHEWVGGRTYLVARHTQTILVREAGQTANSTERMVPQELQSMPPARRTNRPFHWWIIEWQAVAVSISTAAAEPIRCRPHWARREEQARYWTNAMLLHRHALTAAAYGRRCRGRVVPPAAPWDVEEPGSRRRQAEQQKDRQPRRREGGAHGSMCSTAAEHPMARG